MSFWFITLGTEPFVAEEDAIALPAAGLPDLSRALSIDHLRDWIKHVNPYQTPEFIDEKRDYYWKLLQSLRQDDHIILQTGPDAVAIGELTGKYYFDAQNKEHPHRWRVRWVAKEVPLHTLKELKRFKGTRVIMEMPAGETRIMLRKYFPSLTSKGYIIFRWVSIGILVAELVYFWPKQ